jgi:multidrug resistance efflux pump
MKLGRLILIEVVIVLVVAILALGGYYFYYQGQHYVSTDDAQLTAGLVTSVALAPGQIVGSLPTAGKYYKSGSTLMKEKVSVPAQGTHPATSTTVDVTAPVSGRIASVEVLAGQYVQPGTPLAQMVGWEGNTVVAYVPETQIGSVKVGQAVDVTIDAYPNDTFPGHVQAIVPATQAALSILPTTQSSGTFTKVTQRVPVYVKFENPDNADLYMGLSVEVRIHTGS